MPASQISNNEVIPVINSNIFEGHEDSHLAVGIVALGNVVVPGREAEYDGYTLLRGNVYARQKNYMPIADLNENGTETDVDDSRSVHFAVIENAMNNTRVVGAMRLIVKSKLEDAPLPIEEHYPSAFEDGPAPLLSTEVSRLICRHENPKIQGKLKWPLFTAGVTYVMEHQLGPVFGAVEKEFEKSLGMAGVPVTPLGEAIYVPEFNATKLPIRVDVFGLSQKIEGEHRELRDAMQSLSRDFVYSGTSRSGKPKEAVA